MNKKFINNKIFILVIVFMCTLGIFLSYSAAKNYFIKNNKDNNKVVEKGKEMYTTYIENNNGQYIKYRSTDATIYPSGYTFNASKSYCEDLYGNKLDGVLTNTNTSFTLESDCTAICYLYFDK